MKGFLKLFLILLITSLCRTGLINIEYTIQEILDYNSLGYCPMDHVFKLNDKTEFSLSTFKDKINPWTYHSGIIFDREFNFGYHIIYNKSKKIIAVSFSGTKGAKQLIKEFFNKHGVYFENTITKNMHVMKYFSDLYDLVKERFFKDFIALVDSEIIKSEINSYKFIFSGHSLGSAMASLFLFKCSEFELIPTIKGVSPVLMTTGGPRVGNYAFANELSKRAGKIYRFLQEGDIIGNIPNCAINGIDQCYNDWEMSDINLFKNNYDDVQTDVDYFKPWHTNGLIMVPYSKDKFDDLYDCRNVSEGLHKCGYKETITSVERLIYIVVNHSRYWNVKISGYCKHMSEIGTIDDDDEEIDERFIEPYGESEIESLESLEETLDPIILEQIKRSFLK